MNKKTVADIDVTGKRVLMRVDFNVPLSSQDPADEITVRDANRIEAALPTINHLLEQNPILILCTHVGRPKSANDIQFSTKPIGLKLSEYLGRPVTQAPAVVGEAVEAIVAAAKPGDVILLENTRFEDGEEENSPELSAQLANLADVYVNDALGTAHRAHPGIPLGGEGGRCVPGDLCG